MALQQDYIKNNGETIPNCYWKIGVDDGIKGGKHKIEGRLYCYENQEQADLNQNELTIYGFEFMLDMGNPLDIIKQAYVEIKEHPFFENAIDV